MQFLDEYQVQIFLNSARKMQSRFYAYFFLAIHTGMRTGELLGLKWKDINWDKKSLLVRRQVQHPKGGGYIFTKLKSKSSQRSIALGDQAIEVLKQQRSSIVKLENVNDKDWDNLDLVFPSSVGTPLMRKRLRDNFYLVLKVAGLPRIRLHDLRHTAASLLLNHGVPVLIVSKRIGHSKPSITMDVYGHVIPTIQESAAYLMTS
jgi:integrase